MTVSRVIETGRHPVQVHDLRPQAPARPSILVLKLDHLGDLIIGAPSLRRLREAFPESRIRLVVGSWNREAAETLGVADEVAVYDFFSATGWRGAPEHGPERFAEAVGGAFDVAVDLRVDRDTRPLLQQVDAGLRCGVGSPVLFPYLDVALPAEDRGNAGFGREGGAIGRIGADQFTSNMPVRRPLWREAPLRPQAAHLVFGPHVRLPLGPLEVRFDLRLRGLAPLLTRSSLTVDIARDGREIGVHRRLRGAELARLGEDGLPLMFHNDDPLAPHEFRVHLDGRPSPGRLLFGGVAVSRAGGEPPSRLRPSALHTGEQLSLLVQLVRDRALALYGQEADGPPPSGEIVVAPFSNSDLRDWPADSYARLIGLLARETGRRVALIGAPRQADALEQLREASGGGERVVNLGGRTAWAELPDRLRRADLVICNNSGVAHSAAAAGARLLALYSASHQPGEWGPRGLHAKALMTAVPCSPCGFDRLAECPFEHRCMTELTPELVFAEALRRLDGPA